MREAIESIGADRLVVDDLTKDDLDRIGWSGNRSHLRNVAEKVEAASRGELDYLAVRGPDGEPVAKGAIVYEATDAAEIMQLATHPDLQGLGIASRLIAVAEKKINSRGLRWAVLGVEDDDGPAAVLYRRLGYEAFGTSRESWMVEDEEGREHVHHAVLTMMRKELG